MGNKTKGTKEWAYRNLNLYKGCNNGCVYCYAYRMAKRFKRVKDIKDWKKMKPNDTRINKSYKKLKNPNIELYDYMFPTSHDITPEIVDVCIKVLRKILRSGNSVLITTKPNIVCMPKLIYNLEEFKEQICFRFTITSAYNKILKIYEPNAPSFEDRQLSVKKACDYGYKTSLSLEPLLDISPLPIIERVERWVNDTIWIGIMSGKVPKALKKNYTMENMKKIYEECRNLPQRVVNKIRFKDSIQNMGFPFRI